MTPQNSNFIKKAIELDIIAPRQAPRFIHDYEANPGGADNIAIFLVSRGILSPQDANQILAEIKKESQSLGMIGEYQILSKLGEGGMGAVYKTQGPQGIVAVKVIASQYSQQRELIQRFIKEVSTTMKLNHPNVVRSLDYGVDVDQDLFYGVQEFVDGTGLDNLLAKRGKLSLKEALNITGQVAQGLAYAESQGLIHRDIKPANLLISKQGVVKIADFGLVKDDSGDRITKTGSILGTPSYMSPEQSKGEKDIDIRTDIYALGVVLFKMLTGRRPFTAKLPMQVMLMHTREPFPQTEECRPVQGLLDGMTAKEKEKRWGPGEVLNAVRRMVG